MILKNCDVVIGPTSATTMLSGSLGGVQLFSIKTIILFLVMLNLVRKVSILGWKMVKFIF